VARKRTCPTYCLIALWASFAEGIALLAIAVIWIVR
jgi:hypothetical protein